MNVLVCIKQILDPEIPTRDFRIDASGTRADSGSASFVTNIFCENALETALQLRERLGVGRITVLSYGVAGAEESLRKALAMKADEAVLVTADDVPPPDPIATACVLAAAIRKLGPFDLVMVGREAGDWGAGQTGGLLAEELGLPCLSFVDRVEPHGDGLRVRRQTDTGWEVFDATPPLVVTITNDEQNVPRIPKVRDVMSSYRAPLTTWTVAELGVDATTGAFALSDLAVPHDETACEIVSGETLEAKVDAFAKRIAEITRSF